MFPNFTYCWENGLPKSEKLAPRLLMAFHSHLLCQLFHPALKILFAIRIQLPITFRPTIFQITTPLHICSSKYCITLHFQLRSLLCRTFSPRDIIIKIDFSIASNISCWIHSLSKQKYSNLPCIWNAWRNFFIWNWVGKGGGGASQSNTPKKSLNFVGVLSR